MSVVPATRFAPGGDGTFSVQLSGDYLHDPERDGLKTTGGTKAGSFDETFTFELFTPPPEASYEPLLPGESGAPASTWELRRLAAPLPTLLPSYNQIGFDSLHFVVGLVEGNEDGTHGVGWLVEGRPDPQTGETVTLPLGDATLPASVRAFALVDTYPVGLDLLAPTP